MPSHTEKERSKNPIAPKKAKTPKKKAKKSKRPKTMAEQMGWTSDTENIYLRGNLQPSIEG